VSNPRESEAAEWDRQIERDAMNGKLERFYLRLMKDETGEPKVSIDDVLDDSRYFDAPRA
jgi:hypothetical protein